MAASGSNTLLPSFAYHPSNAVTLLVGPDQQPMLVHEHHITKASEFFTAALKKKWIEGQTRTIKFPEADPTNMAHYLTYVYERKLPTHKITTEIVAETFLTQEPYAVLAKLFVLGEQLLDRSVQKAVIEELDRLRLMKDEKATYLVPGEETVNVIYSGTPENSPARRWLVDVYTMLTGKDWVNTELESAFVIDVANALIDKSGNSVQRYGNRELSVERYYP